MSTILLLSIADPLQEQLHGDLQKLLASPGRKLVLNVLQTYVQDICTTWLSWRVLNNDQSQV